MDAKQNTDFCWIYDLPEVVRCVLAVARASFSYVRLYQKKIYKNCSIVVRCWPLVRRLWANLATLGRLWLHFFSILEYRCSRSCFLMILGAILERGPQKPGWAGGRGRATRAKTHPPGGRLAQPKFPHGPVS